MTNLPIKVARDIAREYGWDQVIVITRKVGPKGYEHVVTYGNGAAHCEAAARAGMAVKHHLMKWPAALFNSSLRILGVGRDAENRKALSISLSVEPTDDDIRMIHDILTPPTMSPHQIDAGA